MKGGKGDETTCFSDNGDDCSDFAFDPSGSAFASPDEGGKAIHEATRKIDDHFYGEMFRMPQPPAHFSQKEVKRGVGPGPQGNGGETPCQYQRRGFEEDSEMDRFHAINHPPGTLGMCHRLIKQKCGQRRKNGYSEGY